VYDSNASEPRLRVHHSGKVSTLGCDIDTASLSDDGSLLLTSGHDGTARVWDTTSGAELHRFDHVNEAIITDAGFGPGCKSIFTVGTDCSAPVWSLRTGEEVLRIDDRHNGTSTGWSGLGVRSAGLSRDGSRLWVELKGGLAQLWPCTQWEELPIPVPTSTDGGKAWIVSAQSLRKRYVGTADHEGRYRVFDIESGAVKGGLDLMMQPDHVLVDEWDDIVLASCYSLCAGGFLVRRAHPPAAPAPRTNRNTVFSSPDPRHCRRGREAWVGTGLCRFHESVREGHHAFTDARLDKRRFVAPRTADN
jgi:WD40 repeat protein